LHLNSKCWTLKSSSTLIGALSLKLILAPSKLIRSSPRHCLKKMCLASWGVIVHWNAFPFIDSRAISIFCLNALRLVMLKVHLIWPFRVFSDWFELMLRRLPWK
jgi:hypothetical protein